MSEKLFKPILETTYLTAENVKRYRTILRYFYLQYEKIRYWINQEDVYDELKTYPEFAEYTVEQCRQDLNALVAWNNLSPMQDTKKVTSIEAFKNKQFRYQLTEYSVEIERMVVKLENLSVEGASLEPTLLERIRRELQKISQVKDETPLNLHSWWNSLNNDFIRLNQNYQDYMRQLNSAKAEELMKTKEFLVFKDKLIEYMRSFVKGLQLNVGIIEKQIISVKEEELRLIFSKVLTHELSIPRIDRVVKKEEIYENITGRWSSLRAWFVGDRNEESEASRLFDMTNESIRKITRYASQISEQFSGGVNRKEEYRQLAKIFTECTSMKDAHKLASAVFGVEKPLHLKGEFSRETDSINSGVYEETSSFYELSPRVRSYKETFERSFMKDNREEKESLKEAILKKLEDENRLVESYIKEDVLEFETLPVITTEARAILLRWLSKALENKNGQAKTEKGRTYGIVNKDEKRQCLIHCTDGQFKMPAFIMEFETEIGREV